MPQQLDLIYDDRADGSLRPSWSRPNLYINKAHERAFRETSDIPGWQMEGDTFKLFEMAYFAGDVILEIGTYMGRSAVASIKGALSNPERTSVRFFGVEINPGHVLGCRQTLLDFKLDPHAAIFGGDLRTFANSTRLTPTMVFLDGDHRYDGVKSDLSILATLLTPGVPVLCHDYLHSENGTPAYGVRRAVDEWVQDGYAKFVGAFSCSALLTTTERCRGARVSSDKAFEDLRRSLRGPMDLLVPRRTGFKGAVLRQVAKSNALTRLYMIYRDYRTARMK